MPTTRKKRPRLKVLPSLAGFVADADGEVVEVTVPEGIPTSARVQPWTIQEDYPALGILAGDVLVAWRDAPAANSDLVLIVAREEDCMGRYHTAPGGRIKVDDGEGYCVFKPSDILRVDRVMHVERKGKVVRKFPLERESA